MVFTLRHRRHVGGRKQKISLPLLFVDQPLPYIAALLSVFLEISWRHLVSGQFVFDWYLLYVALCNYFYALANIGGVHVT